jgi:mannosyltransferase
VSAAGAGRAAAMAPAGAGHVPRGKTLRARHVLRPLLVVLGAFALRLHELGARSLWTDEGSTWTAARGGLAAIVKRCAEREESPPLYYLLTHVALRLGDGEVALRMVPALASTLLVWLTYRFARLYAGRGQALVAATLVALSPFQVMYAQEARSYALAALFMVASLYLFARAFQLGRRRAWLPYVLVTALGLWTQVITLLGIGTQALLLLGRPDRRRTGRWLLAQAVVALLYAPWLALSWGRGESAAAGHWYLSAPDAHQVFRLARAVAIAPVPIVRAAPGSSLPGLAHWLGAPAALWLVTVLTLVPFALAFLGLRAPAQRRPLLATLLGMLLLPPAVVLAASPWVSLWLPRFFVFLSVPFALLTAHGLARLRPRALGVAWSAALALLAAFGLAQYQSDAAKEDWRGVARHIAAHSTPGRTIVLVMFDEDAFRFYDAQQPAPLPTLEVSHADAPLGGTLTLRQRDEVEAGVRQRIAGYDDVWVVRRSLTSESRREMTRRTDAVAAESRRLLEDRTWHSPGGPVTARRWVR